MKLGLKQSWQRWWSARHPLSDSHLMGQRNIYILPSRPGLAFCATLALLLLASINDQLSLGYLLTFLLTGAGLASMHNTHANLRGLSLDLKPPAAVFAGDDVQLELRLHNDGAARFGIGVHVQGAARSEIAWTDVPALGHALLTVRFPSGACGRRTLPALQIVTRFPLGLFRSWSVWRPAAQVWIYPKAEQPTPPFPAQQAQAQGSGNSSKQLQRGQDFEGVRGYRRGDSMRQVLWKKAALSLEQGSSQLWVRDTHAPVAQTLWLDWRDAAPLAEPARASRLCAWLLAAERLQAPYGLRLPSGEWPPDLGDAHAQQCLEHLTMLACQDARPRQAEARK
ncbi:DUF58 domain-containing protein [Roseateles oligotrophus]|uniref:DUF58 domain-containing protein n=1 Tax=Roseateles oligotrophus TaxID=1769250 RepID=A0ABT2YGH3_9BURK|nr:DUF58 domain-containing protein [Roseateles oligotrophus]MCV2369154.1 DUF58 domain-containing protein [Roseateles oligotrophus]